MASSRDRGGFDDTDFSTSEMDSVYQCFLFSSKSTESMHCAGESAYSTGSMRDIYAFPEVEDGTIVHCADNNDLFPLIGKQRKLCVLTMALEDGSFVSEDQPEAVHKGSFVDLQKSNNDIDSLVQFLDRGER